MKGGSNKNQHRLWLARKRRGLKQKQIAHLLSHKSIDQISRYENGTRLPKLQTALKLEIIYGIPLRLLFSDLYVQLRGEVKDRALISRGLSNALPDLISGDGRCSYAELMSSPTVSPEELLQVRDHVTDLAKKMAYL